MSITVLKTFVSYPYCAYRVISHSEFAASDNDCQFLKSLRNCLPRFASSLLLNLITFTCAILLPSKHAYMFVVFDGISSISSHLLFHKNQLNGSFSPMRNVVRCVVCIST